MSQEEVLYRHADGSVEVVTDHCYHHSHDAECGAWEYGDCDDDANDDCVHCPCCCTCLGCEYGPQDGMLMYPNGAPWADEALAAASHSTQPTEEETTNG